MTEADFQTLLQYFKVLANESRLKILGILANQECSVEELATLLDLKEPTISHHLAKLKESNLVSMSTEGNTHLYQLDAEGLQAINKHIFTPEEIATLVDDIQYDAWERKILQNFLEGERLKTIPASRKKRLVILRWLASQFDETVRYPEKEINEIIKRHHPDSATIRREFIIHKFMERQDGIYWRVSENS